MKITGVLVEMLVELNSKRYRSNMVFENGNKFIHVVVLKEIYLMLIAALLFFNKFCGDLENIGFELNPYNPCVSNRIKVCKQNTVIYHFDNVISSHVNPNINDKFKEWMKLNYGGHG